MNIDDPVFVERHVLPVTITLSGQQSKPGPTIASGLPRRYMQQHPTPNDILLVCEASDFALNRDQNEKLT